MKQGIALAAVAEMLPPALADGLEKLKLEEMLRVEEIRLRRGYPMTVLLPEGECPLGGENITEEVLRSVLERATQASTHTALDQIRQGFVTLRGGHRIGLCGTVSRRDGETVSLRYLSSMSLRIARAVEGQAGGVVRELMEQGRFVSTLIVGPPGSGKTTLLRELIRTLSDGHGVPAHRVGLADERGEIAALWQGEPQFRVGRRTDILDGCPKAEALGILLRGMNPQILAADEITQGDDVRAMIEAVGCGAALMATAHGESLSDLERRPIYRRLLTEKVFGRVVVLERRGAARTARVERLP
ncbi:MAG: ATPase, T2SS/T4P/T4SS family [Oscillospiraceae bacterium]|nr:ATPase, T2SS/T4P/T4SS family [Oscillospiraceae bacterium]